MKDFDGTPFVAGSVVGVRGFNVDTLGRLIGLHHPAVFKPGLNAGKHTGFDPDVETPCGLAVERYNAQALRSISSSLSLYGGIRTPSAAQSPALTKCSRPGCIACGNDPADHKTAGLNCTCGFYAYFDQEPVGQVSAVIEGTGTVTMGTLGFRAQNAALLAIVNPTSQPGEVEAVGDNHPRWDRWADFLYRHTGVESALVTFAIFGTIAGVFLASALFSVAWWAGLIGLLLPVTAGTLGLVSVRGWSHGLDREYPNVSPNINCKSRRSYQLFDPYGETSLSAERWALVRRNYPDVPVYSSLAAALEAHPTTKPEPVTPETAADFWDREVSA